MNQSIIASCLIIVALLAPGSTQASLVFDPPPGLSPGDTYHAVFVTGAITTISGSTSVPPPTATEFGSAEAADWIVNFQAFVSGNNTGWNGLDLNWTALIATSAGVSTPAEAITDRVSIEGPVYNMNGDLVATSEADMFDGSLANPIAYDEFGALISGNTRVWTGAAGDGTTAGSCGSGNWSNSSATAFQGDATSSEIFWITDGVGAACSGQARLYGLSPVLTVPAAVPEASSVLVWSVLSIGCTAVRVRRTRLNR